MGYQTITTEGKTDTKELVQSTKILNGGGCVYNRETHGNEVQENRVDRNQYHEERYRKGVNISRRKNFLGLWKRRTGVADVLAPSIYNKTKWLPLCQKAPFRISHYCCNVMKKAPIGKYQRKNKSKPILATMADEGRMRRQAWLRHGCNSFQSKKPSSQPMSFWTEQDVLQYIDMYNLDIASVYGQVVYENKQHQITLDHEGGKYVCTGCKRTGCIFCGFGMHLERDDECRFVRLKKTHPKQYDYCIGGGEWIDNPDYDPDYNGEPDFMGWIDWNPPKLWVPSKEGLGMGFVFDTCNEIYGKEMWKY